MVKSLCEICLGKVLSALDKIPNAGKNLPTVYKETLIERLGWHDLLTPDYLPHISYNLFTQSLRRINFYKCDQVNDRVLQLIEASGCKLEAVTVHQCCNVTDAGLQSITKGQDQLIKVQFSHLRTVTDKGLQHVVSEQLRTVNLTGCTNVSFEGASKLAQRNPWLREVHLSGIDELHGDKATSNRSQERFLQKHTEIIKIASYLGHNLEWLDSQLNQINDDCLLAFAQYCPNLKGINLHGSSRITGEALTKFSIGCMNLESLDLSYCMDLSVAHCSEALWTLPTSLRELSLCGIQLKDETIFVECLQRLTNLRSARLCGVIALCDRTLKQILEYLGHSLTSLDIGGSLSGSITDAGLKAISDHCSQLEELQLSLLPNVTCIELLPLFQDDRALKFKKLFLGVRELSVDILRTVTSSCHNLERLDLSGLTIVKDYHLEELAANCPKISILGLKGCKEVTDRGMSHVIRSCTSLKSVVLAGLNNLTDKTIFGLANTSNHLEKIYLNGCTRISPTAVRYLVDCTIPRLLVQHATPNAQPGQLMAYNLDTQQFCRADLINQKLSII